MSNELFTDAINQITAVDCRFDGDSVLIGAVYIEADTPYPKVLLSNDHKRFYIHLPEDLLHNSDPCYAWNKRFNISEVEEPEAQRLPAEPPADP